MLLKKKVCLLGEISVGKTCLVRRFVHGMFSEKYIATVGVKIDRKEVRIGGHAVEMIIWDIAGGQAEGRNVPHYLMGLSGFLVVADGTRPPTLTVAQDLAKFVEDTTGERLYVMLLNKADLADEWALTPTDEEQATRVGAGGVFKTSAKTGTLVEDAFSHLAGMMLRSSL